VTPAPWSFSRLKSFKNCPRSFYEKSVAKSVVEDKGEATIWGEVVHKHFEERLADGVVLPAHLSSSNPQWSGSKSSPATFSSRPRSR
jgi:hypothetical protein